MLGIMFGGLINGIENEGLIQISKPPFAFGFLKLSGKGSNWLQILPFVSKGSIMTAFFLFLTI